MLSMCVVVHYYDSCCKLKVLLVPQTLLNIIKKLTAWSHATSSLIVGVTPQGLLTKTNQLLKFNIFSAHISQRA